MNSHKSRRISGANKPRQANPRSYPNSAARLSEVRESLAEVPTTNQTDWPPQFAVHLRASEQVSCLRSQSESLPREIRQAGSSFAAEREQLVRQLPDRRPDTRTDEAS